MQIILHYIWLLPLALAAICMAVMDNIADHWSESIFNDPTRFNPQMWNKNELSWKNKWIGGIKANGHKTFKFLGMTFNTFDPFSDWWHRFKSEMIVLIAISMVLCKLYYVPIYTYLEIVPLFGIVSVSVFNLFYNKILKR